VKCAHYAINAGNWPKAVGVMTHDWIGDGRAKNASESYNPL
jgi:hypothetical protein